MAAKSTPSSAVPELSSSGLAPTAAVGMVTSTEARYSAEGLEPYRVVSKMVLILSESNLEEGSVMGVLSQDDIALARADDWPWMMLPAGSFVRHQQMKQGRIKLQSPGWLMVEHSNYGILLDAYPLELLRYNFERSNFLKLPMVRVAAQSQAQQNSVSKEDGTVSRVASTESISKPGKVAEATPSPPAKPETASKEAPTASQDDGAVAFFGCIDLKFGEGGEVCVLEIGDGHTSGFTGAGSFLPNAFAKMGYKRAPLSPVLDTIIEIKALTHDVFIDAGFPDLRPATGVFRRVYEPDLAARVLAAVGGGPCVLKLCDRARGCGVVAVVPEDLDGTLRALLEPAGSSTLASMAPKKAVEMQRAALPEWVAVAQRAASLHGFEEQVAHWQADECPIFLAEALCKSRLVEVHGRHFDGTLRVGFALEEDRSVRLCGSYWKLPDGSVDDASGDLNLRVVSHTHGGTGTAKCEADDEEAVWNILQKALPAVLCINTRRFSVPGIMERYGEDPILSVMALARVAGGLATAKPDNAARTLMLAEESLPHCSELEPELLADMARSYVMRTKGTLLARRQGAKIEWNAGEQLYQESLTIMPQNAAAAYLKGMVSFMRRSYTAAARAFASSLALDCDFAPAYSQLATCCLLLGEPSACIDVSEALITRHWRVAAGHQILAAALYAQEAADCSRNLKRRARALEALSQAKKLQRGKSWGKEDDDMQAALEGEEPVPKVPVRTWLFHTWRL